MCYDVSCRSSFLSVRSWLEALLSQVEWTARLFHSSSGRATVPPPSATPPPQEPNAAVVLCACKADVPAADREVPTAEGSALSAVLGVPFFETSAKTGTHVREAVHGLALEVALRQEGGGHGRSGDERAAAAASGGAASSLADRLTRLEAGAEPFRVIDDGTHPAGQRCTC